MPPPFFGPGGRRAVAPEIAAHIAAEANAVAVPGLRAVIDVGDARVSEGGRVSSFQEMHDRREWLLPLQADRPLVLETAPVPATDLGRVLFVLSLGFGNGSPLPQPGGEWEVFVNDRFALSLRVVNHRQLWRGPDCALAFDARRVDAPRPAAR